MSDIPASQLSQNATPIFVNPDGSPMQIFVEAGGVNNRPALVRKLKKAGASICIDPKNAQVILVDDNTDQGRHFIRDWGRDENKVILKHLWVEKCRNAGRNLTTQDDWGGCLTADDGLPIGVVDNGEQPNGKSPLPTPRETPVANLHGTPHHQTPIPSHSRTSSADTTIPPVGPARLGTPQQTLSSGAQQMATTDNQSAIQGAQQLLQNSMQGVFPSQVPPTHLGMPGPYLPQNGVVGMPPEMLATLMANPQFGSALADAMRSYAYSGLMPFTGPSGQPFQGQSPMYNSETSYSASFNGADTSRRSQSPFILEDETKINDLPPFISRKASSSVTPSTGFKSSKSRGKQRETSLGSSKSHITQSTMQSSPSAITTVSKIFSHKNGDEFSFYVEVELHNRKDVVSTIKKNGGKITPELAAADFAVLQTRGTVYTTRIRDAAAKVETPAVTANFIFDCAKRVELLDYRQYLFDNPKKRGRNTSESEDDREQEDSEEEREKRRLVKNQKQREYMKKKKEMAAAKTPQKKTPSVKPKRLSSSTGKTSQVKSTPSVTHGPRSPSPPPLETREMITGSGNYKYSEHERKFVLDYAKVLLQRDHQISYTGIANAMHKKLPHHTLGSWRTFVGRDVVDQIDELRRKASIAYRKALSQQQSQEALTKSRESTAVASTPAPVEPPMQTQTANTTSYTAIEEEDLTTLAHYFAYGGGDEDDQDDAQVWARLKATSTCKSAPSWEDFWNKHGVEVNRRYEAIIAVEPSAEADGS